MNLPPAGVGHAGMEESTEQYNSNTMVGGEDLLPHVQNAPRYNQTNKRKVFPEYSILSPQAPGIKHHKDKFSPSIIPPPDSGASGPNSGVTKDFQN